ncbi:class II aldolase/adducin family protein [Nocardia concava]|uniref:class II aldolase/adducin family protein n=1 Tax=Nocardia concava TaxID=257281 RepID=UPI00030B6DC6|nr:class II aldolase/adducin family protein [Nocardia concava]
MSHKEFDEARAAVAAAAQRLAAAGLLIGTAGNVSLKVGEHVAVTATGVRLAEAGPEHVTVVDAAGRVVAGELAPTSELELHLGVYARFDAGAVVHTHAIESTALGLVVDEIPCLHYQQLLLGGVIRVAPFATFGTPELAAHVLAALDGKRAALMANHGAVALGSSLDDAVENTLLLEWLCEIYRKATVSGPVRTLSEEQQLAVIEAALRRGYGTTHRLEEQDT